MFWDMSENGGRSLTTRCTRRPPWRMLHGRG